MRNLISELLSKLAEKEEESKDFVAQIEALQIVVVAMLQKMEQRDRQAIISDIEAALNESQPKETVTAHDAELLKRYLSKLLTTPND